MSSLLRRFEADHCIFDAKFMWRLSRPACSHDSCIGQGRWLFRGRLQSKTEISGHVAFLLAPPGGYHENPERLTITKLILSDQTPDQGGLAPFLQQLLSEMAIGPITGRYDARLPWLLPSRPDIKLLPSGLAEEAYRFLPPEFLRHLGRIQVVFYVGAFSPRVGFDDKALFVHSDQPSSIYDVEFERGELLCALHRRSDGILDFFRCI